MPRRKITLNEAQQEFINRNLIPLFDEYKNYDEKLLAKTQEGYMIFTNMNILKGGSHPRIIDKSNPYTIQNIKLWCKLNNKQFILLSEEYKNTSLKLKWKCLKSECQDEFLASWGSIKDGNGCSCCAGMQVGLSNCLAIKRPDLIKYLKNKEDGYKYTLGSRSTINLICPNCMFEKPVIINTFTRCGFGCPKCSDGISYPEKFMFNVLEQLKFNFKNQLNKTTFEWCKDYKYDFYISQFKCIIETHGDQHYTDKFREHKKTLKEEQQNDKYKKELALNNNIKNYIVLDCRKSEIEFIKNSIMESNLPQLLNFKKEDIDWLKCHEYACNSLVKIVCDLWNNNINIKRIENKLQLSDTTIRKYLYQGTELNWCNYNGKEELIKMGFKNGVFGNIKIICLNTNEIFNSMKDALIKYNMNSNHISTCCKGKRKSAGKHPITGEKLVWMYYEDWEAQQS